MAQSNSFSGRLLNLPERDRYACFGAELKVSGTAFSEIVPQQGNGTHDILVMPPFSNAHDHARGVRPISIGAFDLPLELWLVYMTKSHRWIPTWSRQPRWAVKRWAVLVTS